MTAFWYGGYAACLDALHAEHQRCVAALRERYDSADPDTQLALTAALRQERLRYRDLVRQSDRLIF